MDTGKILKAVFLIIVMSIQHRSEWGWIYDIETCHVCEKTVL